MKSDTFFVLLALLLSACTPKTSEQKLSVSKTKLAESINNYVGPAACSKIEASVKAASTVGVDVLGTFTNNCEKKIRYAELEISCLDKSGKLIELDTEYVMDIYPGKDAHFESPFMSSPDQISECNINIVESEY